MKSLTTPRAHRANGAAPTSRSRSRRIIALTGIAYGLIGLMLAFGGIWLLALGGAPFGPVCVRCRIGHHTCVGGRRSSIRLVATRGARRRYLSTRCLAAHALGDP